MHPRATRFGRFELKKRIGAGGMAEVFLAVEHLPEDAARLAVLKRILPHHAKDPDFVEFFVHEAKLALALQHPNIVHSYDFGVEGGVHYLAMEYVHGETLLDVVRRANDLQRTLSVGTVVRITADLLAALDHTHTACDLEGMPLGIVHRDVTPQNILISHRGAVKLADFGVARTEGQAFRTRTGVVKGKFSYLAPEVLARDKRYDSRVDLFAVGIVMFEALSGRSLFRGKTDAETVQRVQRAKIPDITKYRPDCPPVLSKVIERALQRDPEQRWPSAAAMLQAVDEASAEVGLAANVTRLRWELSALFPGEHDLPIRPDTVPTSVLDGATPAAKLNPNGGPKSESAPADNALEHYLKVAGAARQSALIAKVPARVQTAGTLEIDVIVPSDDEVETIGRPLRQPAKPPPLPPEEPVPDELSMDELPPPSFPGQLLEQLDRSPPRRAPSPAPSPSPLPAPLPGPVHAVAAPERDTRMWIILTVAFAFSLGLALAITLL